MGSSIGALYAVLCHTPSEAYSRYTAEHMRFLRALAVFLVAGVGAVFAASLVVNVLLHVETAPYRMTLEQAPTSALAIIPGASVYPGGKLSPLLAMRADTAIALYKAHRVDQILVSGDSISANHDEVGPIHAYLRAAGIPESDLLLDGRGVDTYSTLFRARFRYDVTSALIVSQAFHLPRAVFLARSFGINAYGVVAGTGETAPKDAIREFFADEKALLNVLSGRFVSLQ